VSIAAASVTYHGTVYGSCAAIYEAAHIPNQELNDPLLRITVFRRRINGLVCSVARARATNRDSDDLVRRRIWVWKCTRKHSLKTPFCSMSSVTMPFIVAPQQITSPLHQSRRRQRHISQSPMLAFNEGDHPGYSSSQADRTKEPVRKQW
jgi:hypothetical protein